MSRRRSLDRRRARAGALTALCCACAAAAFTPARTPARTPASVPAPAPKESSQAQAKLASVRARIAELTQRLSGELQERDALSARVRDVELVITAQRRRLDSLRAAEAQSERRGSELRAQMAVAQREMEALRAGLSAQIRAAYMMGRQEELKLLLNQGDPASLGRALAYHGYFARQRSDEIGAVQREALRLDEVAAEIDRQSARLKALKDEASRTMSGLTVARGQRAEALGALKLRLASSHQELGELRREEAAVESLVAELSRAMQDFPTDPTKSFDTMRGKLQWPVSGRVTARYQDEHAASAPGIRWNGEMIEGAPGAKVRAPYFGRIVYADWLQGLGLLLIIGHSGGYMTLYGHAEVLYKAVGDWVAPGDVIAALGDGGGAPPQLYFEIREGRKTVNPKAWLRPNP